MFRLNWGHKIAIVYSLFVAFMIVMVVRSTRHNHELVTQEYYAREVLLQGKIDASKNMANADFQVEINRHDGGVQIRFVDLDSRTISNGKVNLYKPDNLKLDEEHTLTLDGAGTMFITPKGGIGKYKLSLDFTIDATSYYAEKNIYL